MKFEKKLIGQPPTGEKYTIKVSRLVGVGYVEYLTFDLDAGIPKTFKLPSTLDPAGITYTVEEINAGTATVHQVTPSTFQLSGNLGETVSVVITNAYASVEIDKTVNSTTANPGQQLTYTLISKNTGGLTLNPVVITDLLPPKMRLISAHFVDGPSAGSCVMVTGADVRPAVVECTMVGALAPGASSPAIQVVGQVDADTAVGTLVLNQALVLGTYVTQFSTPVQNASGLRTNGAVLRPEAIVNGQLSCEPVVAGTVCDVSAQVGTSITEPERQVEPPTTTQPPAAEPPTPEPPPPTRLPVTGSSGIGGMLAIGALLLVTGGVAILVVRRRRPHQA